IVGCAPTGRAAQRIKELTGLPNCSTIHRLLSWSGDGFAHNENCPIGYDAVLIDEASMMDVQLAAALFAAIPPHASILIVGDINQLPSVGAGNVLRDMIAADICPVTHLTQVFRQSERSKITTCSHQINEGQFPSFDAITLDDIDWPSDALWIPCQRSQIGKTIEKLVKSILPLRGYKREDIQLLSPQHKTDVGNIALNEMVQAVWNPARSNNKAFGRFRISDRVIQCKNDYGLTIFNGDIGTVRSANQTDKIMEIEFFADQAKMVNYPGDSLEELQLAYSISVHKSQGSEFPVVIIPATMSHYMMLQRNLLYTAVTRAKALLIVVGEREAIQQAVRVQGNNKRQTRLKERILELPY
ncbi:MAG: ATP-dependent DNA helicase, partial [Microcoleus sp.]